MWMITREPGSAGNLAQGAQLRRGKWMVGRAAGSSAPSKAAPAPATLHQGTWQPKRGRLRGGWACRDARGYHSSCGFPGFRRRAVHHRRDPLGELSPRTEIAVGRGFREHLLVIEVGAHPCSAAGARFLIIQDFVLSLYPLIAWPARTGP